MESESETGELLVSSAADHTLAGSDDARSRAVELHRGEPIGRFVVLARLGSGGMGVVYAAYDPELDRKVAIKLLHRPRRQEESGDDGGHKRLLREAQAMAKLNHPNVVTVHDVGEHEGRVFLAMEFVEGTTLRTWIKKMPRPWRAVLDVFVLAGRGLAAAHEKGLVHRDFKPENVMIGDDGRVRVMDFGLARSERGDEEAPLETLDELERSRESGLSMIMTRQGALLGTPAYMAPEQWEGREIDGRTDQFAFCVALWEGLFRQRPFVGDTPATLAFAVTEGKVREPARSQVPTWLRRTVARGLSVAPERRFSSMSELLAELERGDARQRRQWLFGAGVLVVALASAGAMGLRWQHGQQLAACTDEGAAIYEVWNDDVRTRVSTGLLASGATHAATTTEKLMPWFDAQAEAWREAKTTSCISARVTKVWDEETHRRSEWCLEERRAELEALLGELSRADTTAANRAVRAAAGLHQVAPCLDTKLLERSSVPPTEQGEEARAIAREVARANALLSAGTYDEGFEVTTQTLERATALGWAPLTAETHLVRGRLMAGAGRFEDAESELETAYFAASRAGAIEIALESALALVTVVSEHLARYDDARLWAEHADSLRVLLPDPAGWWEASWLNGLAAIDYRNAEYERAKEYHARALELRERHFGPDHFEVGTTLNNYANVLWAKGELDQAEAFYRRALAIWEEALGPEHPEVAILLNNIAGTLEKQGEHERAIEQFERALAISAKSLGPDHPNVATMWSNLGAVQEELGRYEPALAAHEHALEIREKVLGQNHPDVATTLNNLGVVAVAMGDRQRALAYNEQALRIRESTLEPDHPEIAQSLNNLGQINFELGNLEKARELGERALSILEKTLGPDHVDLARPLEGMANVAIVSGRANDAIILAERAVRLHETRKGHPEDLAVARYVLARALIAADGDPERIRDLCESALVTLREFPSKRATVKDIQAALADLNGR